MRLSPVLSVVAAQALAGLILVAPASAQITPAQRGQMVEQYAQMCRTQAVTLPGPGGESDIKASPKLGAYCTCFSGKFADRAIARYKAGVATAPPLEKSLAEERAMRTACRAQTGLPPIPGH